MNAQSSLTTSHLYWRRLHWLSRSLAQRRIDLVYRLAVLAYRCLHGLLAPAYLSDVLSPGYRFTWSTSSSLSIDIGRRYSSFDSPLYCWWSCCCAASPNIKLSSAGSHVVENTRPTNIYMQTVFSVFSKRLLPRDALQCKARSCDRLSVRLWRWWIMITQIEILPK